jgi:DNA-binding beta-propeller fold protein YncE
MKLIPSFLALAALFSARALAADRLFVFDGDSATVLEAPGLAPVGTLTAGPGAFAAFRVSGRTYVVAADRITVVGDDLRPRAEIALRDASATAAAVDPHTWNLLVAAGGHLYRIDTQADRIASITETGIEPSAIIIPGDSRVAYLMTAGSRQAKVVDLESDRVLPGAADLAAIPGVFAGALIGSGREIFSAEPSPGGIAGLAKNGNGAHALLAASPSGARLLRSSSGLMHIAADGSMTPLDDLSAPLLHAALAAEGDTAYLALADGRVAAVDANEKTPDATAWMASAPTAMALVSDPPQQVTITKVSGDLQSVIAGDDFQLVVTGPIGGIPMTVESDSPAAE